MRGCRSRIAAAARSTSLPVGDVAELVLAAELGRQRLEPLLPPRNQHAVPAPPRELARGRLADAARRAGDDGHPHAARLYVQTRTTRCASALRPFASVTIARSVCLPLRRSAALPDRRVDARAAPRRSVAIGLRPSKNRTERSAAVEDASTRSGVCAARALVAPRASSHVIVGPFTTVIVAGREGRVREELVADGVDVLRLLEVRRGGRRAAACRPSAPAPAPAAGRARSR